MGFYINPPTGTKEDWLGKYALPISEIEASHFYEGCSNCPALILLVWVNNGPFTAVGIAFNERERQNFMRSDDHRPKKYYMAPRDDLMGPAGLADDFPTRLRDELWST